MEQLWNVGLGEAAGAQPLVSVWHLPALLLTPGQKYPNILKLGSDTKLIRSQLLCAI